MISHKKNSLFDEKSFFDKFIFNSFVSKFRSRDRLYDTGVYVRNIGRTFLRSTFRII